MSGLEDLRPLLRDRARGTVSRLSPAEREELLIRCWMSHDARWFMAVTEAFGIEAANRLNRIAVQEMAKVEAQRIVRALRLPPVATLDDYLLVQETLIAILGPDLLDYEVRVADHDRFRMHVRRCFAHENVVRAGIADRYECGIFARVHGWSETLGLGLQMSPELGPCQLTEGKECSYSFRITWRS